MNDTLNSRSIGSFSPDRRSFKSPEKSMNATITSPSPLEHLNNTSFGKINNASFGNLENSNTNLGNLDVTPTKADRKPNVYDQLNLTHLEEKFESPEIYNKRLSQTVARKRKALKQKNLLMFENYDNSNFSGTKTFELSFTGKKYRNPVYTA